ncbi:hypothetical protein NDU88_003330 [Pleurodeles waltl]|uniref:Uncharacterized protein n=1 Tax=Pleurodeles waltl TaxID=8319 RepID=A0AAV7RCL1_PLEWA|nr:hypothetical protein NDU88_003330 [Pleurodeles waltl]
MLRRFSARAPAQLLPSQLVADPRYAAHLTQESRGASPQETLLLRHLRCPSCLFLGAARTPRLLQSASPGRHAAEPGTPGAPLAGRGSATSSIHRSPHSRAQRWLLFSLHGTPAPRQSLQGAGSSESVSPRRPSSGGHFDTRAAACIRARLQCRSPHQDPGGTGRSRGRLARHHWVAKSL